MSMAHVPELPGARALGHGHLFKHQRMEFLRRAAIEGDLTRMRMLHRWLLVVSSPEGAHEILVERAKSFEKSPGLRLVLHDLAGQGLFSAEGELWQRQRRLMAPLFHQGAVAKFASSMSDVTRRVLARWKDGDTIDLAHEMTRITMTIVSATLFGADTLDKADEIGEALTIALKWVDDALASTPLVLQVALIEAFEAIEPRIPARLAELHRTIDEVVHTPVLLPGRNDDEFRGAVRKLDAMMASMIAERRAHPQERIDLLTKLLLVRDVDGRGEGMSDAQVRDEANTLFVAGHETTANALAWAFYLLARHPEARARVQAEADAFGPEGPTSFAPERLAYTTRVFKEALRLYPPLVILVRRSLEPFELQGRSYPRHTLVAVNSYGVHMNPRVWNDPERFDPDRFTPEREATRHKSAWLPFGVGPRVCIGNHFALMEGPIVLATLMRNARFEVDPSRPIEAETFATLRPRGGVPAIVRREGGNFP
jgi:cytochrome P450